MKHSFRNITLLILMIFTISLLLSCEKMILKPERNKPPLPKMHTSRLATILDSLRYTLDLPALAGAIVTDTSIIDAQAVGCRRYGGELNITNNDQFHLGSNTKAITAVLIGILIDDGLLKWTSTLSEIYPEYANTMRPEYKNVTILNLLSHSSGFRRDSPDFNDGTPRDERKEMVQWALNQQPVINRGNYLYSNLGYNTLGAIAEKLTNRQFEELLIAKVLLPLGVTTAGFGPMGTPGMEDQPLQHTNGRAPIEPMPESDLSPIYNPSGRLHLSIIDWAKFIQWVLAAEAGHQTMVSKQTALQLTTSIVSSDGGTYYACGWMIYNSDWAGGRAMGHNGSNGYNYSDAALAPIKHFAVLTTTNMGPGDKANPLDPVAVRLIDLHLKKR
jgi:CubicO group peptidase (beta-lactamase class C family)